MWNRSAHGRRTGRARWLRAACLVLGALALVSLSAVVSAPAALAAWSCHFRETAVEDLERAMKERLFGQPYAARRVLELVTTHVRNVRAAGSSVSAEAKPLALSLHGTTGIGKTMLATLMEKTLYPYDNKQSEWYVRRVDGTQFQHHTPEAEERAFRDIRDMLLSGARRCGVTMFVFDEVNAMSSSMMRLLRPYLGGRALVDGVSFAHCIFVFISNTAADALGRYWYELAANEEYLMSSSEKTMSDMVKAALSHSEDDRKRYEPIVGHVMFVPFFPLTKPAVRQCVAFHLSTERDLAVNQEREVGALAWGGEVIDHLLETRVWSEEEGHDGLFSSGGCRHVQAQVASAVARALRALPNRRVRLNWKGRAAAVAQGRLWDSARGFEYPMRDKVVQLSVRRNELIATATRDATQEPRGDDKGGAASLLHDEL